MKQKLSLLGSLLMMMSLCNAPVYAASSSSAAATAKASPSSSASSELASHVIQITAPQLKIVGADNKMAEGFMMMENQGKLSHRLVAAYAPVDQETLLHKTVMINNQPEMKPVKDILIPSQKETDLKFGGLHVMLIGLNKSLAANTTVPLTLIFEDGSAEVIQAKVIA